LIQTSLPDHIAHGFLELSNLRDLPLGKVRCYQFGRHHLGFTIFAPDEQSTVYVQMYKLPQATAQLKEDLAFQTKSNAWGVSPRGDILKLNIFPAIWTHAALSDSPRRIVHQYKSAKRALFIRYIGRSLEHPLLSTFNQNLRYLPNAWHTTLVDHELAAPVAPYVPPASTVNTLDLRTEQAAIYRLILDAIKRIATDQRTRGSDVYKLSVSGIILFFDVCNGHVSVHFDVRVPFENDGAYSHQEFASLPRENWRQLIEFFYDGNPVTLTSLEGKARKLSPKNDFNFDKTVGEMILNVLKSMREQKAFTPLLLHPRAELIIEADDGAFAWPARYKDRGKKNRV
jgi:hypothetical protein